MLSIGPRRRGGVAALLLWLAGSGCGAGLQAHYRRLRPALAAGDTAGALATLAAAKDSPYGSKNRLLFELDCAMVLQMAGSYRASNACLERAKQVAEALWTESISAHAAAWVGTDNALPYQGEDFEKVFIHLAAAFNYLSLDDLPAARVEARQVGNKLALLGAARADDASTAYRDDGLARWLAGRLAESDRGDLQGLGDAWIDYRRALQIYQDDYRPNYGTPLPKLLLADALRVLRRLGKEYAGEAAALRARYRPLLPVGPPAARRPDEASLLFILLAGEAPRKRDAYWVAPALDSLVRVAYPVFEPQPSTVRSALLTERRSGARAETELMQDVGAIAVRNLDDHMGRIRGKAIARAVSKFVAARALRAGGSREDAAGGAMLAAGVLLDVGNFVTEEADKRSWVTLPATVHVAELALPPGDHTVDVELRDAAGMPVERGVLQVSVAPGRSRFVTYRSLR